MRTIGWMIILLSFTGAALGQESVRSERLGFWAPQDANTCDTIYGNGRDLCLASRYRMQQDEKALEQRLHLQRAEEESQKLHNELLRRELAPVTSSAAPPSAADFASLPGFATWQAANRWFGGDRPRTEYALLYAQRLRQEQPELTGRPFLNAVAARVKEVFGQPSVKRGL